MTELKESEKMCDFCGKATKSSGLNFIYKIDEKTGSSECLCSGQCMSDYYRMIRSFSNVNCYVCRKKSGEKLLFPELIMTDYGDGFILVCSVSCKIKCRKRYAFRECLGCRENITGEAFKCGKCLTISYCSRECQTGHWKKHEIICQYLCNMRMSSDFDDCCHTCDSCGKQSVKKFRYCSRCKKVYYCSEKCQKKDWKTQHKKECGELSND